MQASFQPAAASPRPIASTTTARHARSRIPFAAETSAAHLTDPDNAPAVRLLTDTLQEATRRNASDLHIEPAEHGWRMRLRIDGVLHEIAQPPAHLRDAFITRVKVLARMDIAERRVPQDGRLRIATSPGRIEDYRVNSLPTLFGEKLVLRRLDALPTDLSLDSLGLDPRQRDDGRCGDSRAARSRARHRTHRQRQDAVAVLLPESAQRRGAQSVLGGRPGGNSAGRHQSGQRARKGRADVRGGAARLSATGPRRDHGRRNPRRRNRRRRRESRANRPPRPVDPAHERRARRRSRA